MNNSNWPAVPLGDLIKRNENVATILEGRKYQEVTIRLWGKGVTRRQYIDGTMLQGARRFSVSKGQFIVSRIDARNGAMGVVPEGLDGAIVTNDFPSYDVNQDKVLPSFMGWICRTQKFVDSCKTASEGTTNRVRLKEDAFLKVRVSLPPINEQRRIVKLLDCISGKIDNVNSLHSDLKLTNLAFQRSIFFEIVHQSQKSLMGGVAPLVRRPITPKEGESYSELGVRSFGRGTFHKPSLDHMAIGTKKIYRIEPGDLVFSNVFAWEGAIAVAKHEDEGRVGSHRFITCVPKEKIVTPEFLCFYFLTPEGMQKIGEASPGGAGRNRTLGIAKLEKIEVPVPSYIDQLRFGTLLKRMNTADAERRESVILLDAIIPSLLDRAFKGEL